MLKKHLYTIDEMHKKLTFRCYFSYKKYTFVLFIDFFIHFIGFVIYLLCQKLRKSNSIKLISHEKIFYTN